MTATQENIDQAIADLTTFVSYTDELGPRLMELYLMGGEIPFGQPFQVAQQLAALKAVMGGFIEQLQKLGTDYERFEQLQEIIDRTPFMFIMLGTQLDEAGA